MACAGRCIVIETVFVGFVLEWGKLPAVKRSRHLLQSTVLNNSRLLHWLVNAMHFYVINLVYM